MDLPFDKIVIEDAGKERELRVGQFMALALPTRIRLVMTGGVKFFLQGDPVPQGEALGALQKFSAARR